MNASPAITYQRFSWGEDDGAENAHTVGTVNADWTASGGSGDLTKVLRGQFDQTIPNADINLTQNIELQARYNGGTWTNVPASGGGSSSLPVEMVASGNFTDGGDTTLRLGSATYSNLTNNNCVEESSYATASFTFAASTQYTWECLYVLKFLDTHLSNGDTLEFRFLKNGSTLLDTYTGANPGVSWSEGGAPQSIPVGVAVASWQGVSATPSLGVLTKAVGPAVGTFSAPSVTISKVSPVELYDSANIASGGAATTARLTPPAGKTTGDFVAGRIEDLDNPADSVAATPGGYTEFVWAIKPRSPGNGKTFKFRYVVGGTPIPLGVTPKLIVSAGQDVAVGPAVGTWQAVGVTPSPGAVSQQANPALGTWLGVPVTPSAGPVTVPAGPALGTWIGEAILAALGAITSPAGPASGTWAGVPVVPGLGAVSQPVGPAAGGWSGVVVVPAFGAVSQGVGPASGTWTAVGITPGLGAIQQAVGTALGTWGGVPVAASLGTLLQAVAAAVASWQGNTVTPVTGTAVPVGPAVAAWQAVGVGASLGAISQLASPAVGAWAGNPVVAVPGSLSMAASPAVGTWAAQAVSAVVGAISASVGAGVGSWEAVTVAPVAGVLQKAVGPALGSWVGVPVGIAGAQVVPVGVASASWEGVTVTPSLGAIAQLVSPATGTWTGVGISPSPGPMGVNVGSADGGWVALTVSSVVGGLTKPVGPALGTWQATTIGVEIPVGLLVPLLMVFEGLGFEVDWERLNRLLVFDGGGHILRWEAGRTLDFVDTSTETEDG